MEWSPRQEKDGRRHGGGIKEAGIDHVM